jgi:ABC-type phosphate transport system ATPase subunit
MLWYGQILAKTRWQTIFKNPEKKQVPDFVTDHSESSV